MTMSAKRKEPECDLFAWRERAEIEAQRKALQGRIEKQSKHSHRRVELTTRMQDLTTRLLQLETKS